MIAKVCPNLRRTETLGCPFGGRIAYISRKAVLVRCINLCGVWQDAREQMQITHGLNDGVRYPATHVVVSWPETERPSDDAMITAARLVMIDMGAANHQMVMAVHRDRLNPHVHVVLNRVHPVTGKALTLWQDYTRLELACRRVEARMGWNADRGRFDIGSGDEGITLVPKPKAHWRAKVRDRALGLRPMSDAARALERRSGLPALIDILAPRVQIWLRHRLATAKSWQEVHSAMRSYDLRYILHRSGARISHRVRSWQVAASQLGTACGLRKLQQRIGTFVSDLNADNTTTALPDPTAPAHGHAEAALVTLTSKFLQPILGKQRQQQKTRLEAREAQRRLIQAQAAEKAAVRQILRGSKSPMAQALRQVMHEQHKIARHQLRSATQGIHRRAALPLDAIAQAHPQEAARRRYRDILMRSGNRGINDGIGSTPGDLTSARQAWFTAPLRTQNSGLPFTLIDAISGYANDIRGDGEGGLLLPRRRKDESIVGFTRIDLTQSAGRSSLAHYGAPGGLIVIGPRDAITCLIVLDGMAALATAVRLQGQPVLIIGVSDQFGPAEAAHLQRLTKGRDITIGSASDIEKDALITRLKDLIPSAKLVRWQVEDGSATIPRGQAGESQPAERSNSLTKRPEPKPQNSE